MSAPAPTGRPALRPAQLNALARDLLEGSFPAIWVEGELSGLARPGSGHLYFILKDERAQVRCALFKPKAQGLRFVPRDGMQVLVRGRLTLYEPRGDYQLVLEQMEETGEGALRRAFEALKAKLAAEGLFASERKRALPRFVRRLGVLSSPSGAVIRDIQSVLARRWPLLEVDLLPVPVQGASAAAAIVQMLRAAAAAGRHDVLLLARGGGSLEDLWCFNDEAVVRAIAASPVPVVAAIGHEVDVTLSDFAADLRAPTPSAAAELLVPDRVAMQARLAQARAQMTRQLDRQLERHRQRIDQLGLRLQATRPQQRLERQREQLVQLAARRDQALLGLLERRRARLRELGRGLHVSSPLATLERGYAILQRRDGQAVRRGSEIEAGEVLRARLAEGELCLRVEAEDDHGGNPGP
ncbi:exodeoxyribonuclease VII large subunit [Silanimonas sp.]|uniref:exodeoxyribonuclease VII large subunit n=1 Tax=Silanimonas sp. TaxID=1929290 RepID=UPI001BB8F33F|nr:exodeoxyribonuclease VII large subunit [Silanimonas sp.]MBS3897018.1 exodeoxyribonuclease VII large subunit [Silanimonas sp.]